MPVDHDENFPVASWLLPARLRAPIEAIYAFARGADDIADEGEASDAERLAGLDRYVAALDAIESGRAPEPMFARLAAAAREHDLPIALLRDLLDAFRQDVTTKRYATFAELCDYARRSANPVGRLLLHLFARNRDVPPFRGNWGTSLFPLSDCVCSGLQFANFWQDVAIDWKKGRVYLPQEDLARFGVDEAQIARRQVDERWSALMAFECARTRSMLIEGAPLGAQLRGRAGLEIRATVEGGLAILDRIEATRGDVFRHRPKLDAAAWSRMLARAILRKVPR